MCLGEQRFLSVFDIESTEKEQPQKTLHNVELDTRIEAGDRPGERLDGEETGQHSRLPAIGQDQKP